MKWDNNNVQFMRLLAEINSNIVFTAEMVNSLCTSMDISEAELWELFDRATKSFDKYKEGL